MKHPRSRRLHVAIHSALAAIAIVVPRAQAELTDKNVHPIPSIPAPTPGQTFVDPTFGSTILRLTGPADGTSNTNAYAYWPTFNRTSTRLFVSSSLGGDPKLYDFNPVTMQASNKRNLFASPAPDGSGFPRWEDAIWSGSDPNVIYGHTALNLWGYNVQNNQYTLVKNFGSYFPQGNLLQMSKSIDDQVFSFTKQDTNYVQTGNFAWRRNTNQLLLDLNDPANTNEVQLDKTGRYLMQSHEQQGANVIQTTIHDLQLNTATPLTDGAPDYAPGHGDLGHGFSVAHENWNNRMLGRQLATPHQWYTVLQLPDFSQSNHLSMLADDESWGLLSNFTANTLPSTGLYKDEILLVATDGSQNVRRLAHHQSVYAGDYWNSPRANISFDGKFVAYTSNWGDLNRRDVYILRVGAAPATQWNTNAAGSWHTASNWSGAAVPNGVGVEVELGSAISAPRTVFIDSPVTVGGLHFTGTSAYNLAGAGSLTLQTSTGSATIDVTAGSHKINLPLMIASNTNLTVAPTASLKIADPLTVNAGKTLTQNGPVTYQSTITLQAGASIDVQSALIAEGSSYGEIQSMVARGFNGGDWKGDGITSSIAAGESGLALGLAQDAGSVLVALTRSGDSDLSGIIEQSDFDGFLDGYHGSAGSSWLNGDFNYDGDVNADDFNRFVAGLEAQRPIQMSPAFFDALNSFVTSENLNVDLSAVPEPTGASLFAMSAAAFLRRRRR